MEKTPASTIKTIVWETNYNNKMVCNAFIHVDLAPTKKPIRVEVEATVFEIRTDDASHPIIHTHIYDLNFFTPSQLTDCLALASHGITARELLTIIENKYGSDNVNKRGLCLYYYIKN